MNEASAPIDPRAVAAFDEGTAAALLENREFPGLPNYLGLELVECTPGRLVAEMAVRDELLTPFGSMHGGVVAAVCDHILGMVCYPHIERGRWAATTEFKLNYLSAVTTGRIRAEATLIAFTKTTAVASIHVRNGDRLACMAQGTVLIRDSKGLKSSKRPETSKSSKASSDTTPR